MAAYGGAELWSQYNFIEAEVSASGLAFKLKGRKAFQHVKLKMEIARPYARLSPIGTDSNITGVLDGTTVRLENEQGQVIAERKEARSFFPGGRRFFRWDDLDMAYFANYAFWNYFTLPVLLSRTDIQWTETKEGTLQAVFPDSLPTHSRQQEFIFDTESGLLKQHNYTVDIFGQWAKAANVVLEHQRNEQTVYDALRLVTPRKRNGRARKGPALIKIEVHSWKLCK